jgi:hemerythrin
MDKLGVLVSSNFLKLRIEKLLPDFESIKIEYKTIHKLKVNLSSAVFNDVRLMIIDLDNFEIDSIEAIKEFRKLEGHTKTPIIVLGNSGDVSVISKAIISGCSDFLLKPFDDGTFMEKVTKLLKNNVTGDKDIKKTHVNKNFDNNEVKTEQTGQKVEDRPIIQWRSDYTIGIDAIDAEHKQIIEHFSKLYDMMRTGGGHAYYKEMLIFLKNYVAFHFENEEALQVKMGYPNSVEHQEVHAYYRKKFTELFDAHLERQVTDEDLIQINLLLKKFLVDHILVEDKKIGEYSQKEIKN